MILAKFLIFVAVIAVTFACQECDIYDCTHPVFDCFSKQRETKFYHNHYYSYNGLTLPECLEICRTDIDRCKSVNYYCQNEICDLHSESAATYPERLQFNRDAIYFERKACGNVQTDYECFTRTSGRRLTDYFSSVTADNEEHCVHLCLSVENLCSAASFDSQTNQCRLATSLNSESDTNSEYFEKTCNSECFFTRTDARYLAGYNDYTEDANSVHECIVKCALRNVAENQCKSAEYQSVLKKCYMSGETKSVNPTKFRQSSSYTYVELDCGDSPINTDCITTYQSSYYAGNTYTNLSGSTEESCKDACNQDTNCRSALYAKSRNSNDLKEGMFLLNILSFVVFFVVISAQNCPGNNCKCFDEFNGRHLTTYAKKIEGRSEEECRGSCLAYPELCLSAQYDRTNKLCYLNKITHVSSPSIWKTKGNFVYWYRREECHRNCYFIYHWKKYLLGYNDQQYLSYTSYQCLEACMLNQNFDCKSIDYDRQTGECTLSRESKDTKPNAFLSHIKLEHFHKVCKSDNIEVTPCYQETIDGQYLTNHAKLHNNKQLDECHRLCLSATFTCRSIHYNKSSKKCYLNKETHKSRPNWIRFDNNYVYYLRDENCDFNCYYQYNWRRYIPGFKLGPQHNNITSLECMEKCYLEPTCQSFDYDRNGKRCQLHTESKLTKPNVLQYSSFWENYHKVCAVSKEYICFNSFSNAYLNDLYTEYKEQSEEECISICLFNGHHCKSASYNKRTRKCYITRKTKSSHSNLYFNSQDYRYFEKKLKCQPDCMAIPFKDYYLKGHTLKALSANDDFDCLESCLSYTPQGVCKSASWRDSTKTCLLHDESRITRPFNFKQSNYYVHWDVMCHGKCFTEYPFRYLSNQAYAIIDTTEDRCKYYCLIAKEGCRSAYYNRRNEKCYLTTHTQYTKPNSFIIDHDMVYWERKTVCPAYYYFTVFDGHYLQGHNMKEYVVQDDAECLELCFTQHSFNCKSAEYNKRTRICYLSDENRQTIPHHWRSSSQFIYFEKTHTN
ncbi:DgyrCDS12447 [Dimorphilus gyrociliatus]|uniref:DgyrCDS12447 n=1 Tax=Dimorphilus gyrociliatus TaxID=2664684 RepID=A0A7I8W7Z6_9ANNE|nr:DgyrCDS12447 [Dimorphilus gyrociliatus]